MLLSTVLLATSALPGIVYTLLDDGARTALFQVLILLFNIQALTAKFERIRAECFQHSVRH